MKKQFYTTTHASSDDERWKTPSKIINAVLRVFDGEIDLDPCSNLGAPAVPASVHYTINDDGLQQPWFGNVFANPPYGRGVKFWIDKALAEHNAGNTYHIILLLASRTETKWTKDLDDFVRCHVHGRLRFEGTSRNTAPFPSVLFSLTDTPTELTKFIDVFSEMGTCFARVNPYDLRR